MKIDKIILFGTSVLFFGLYLHQCKVNKSLNEASKIKTDTIYKPLPYKPSKDLIIPNPPLEVIFYPRDTNYHYKELVLIKDTIRLYNNELDKFDINSDYLLQYPKQPKLLEFDLSKSEMKFTLLETSGSIIGRGYSIDTDKYKYRFNGTQLTSEPLIDKRLHPYFSSIYFTTSYIYRPLPNFHDLNFNLNIETKKFIYTLGINGYHYPRVNSKGITPQLQITYKF